VPLEGLGTIGVISALDIRAPMNRWGLAMPFLFVRCHRDHSSHCTSTVSYRRSSLSESTCRPTNMGTEVERRHLRDTACEVATKAENNSRNNSSSSGKFRAPRKRAWRITGRPRSLETQRHFERSAGVYPMTRAITSPNGLLSCQRHCVTVAESHTKIDFDSIKGDLFITSDRR
jgi:hypothetical protein